jgi:hypothetical protein
VERALARAEPSVIARFFVTTSRASPSLLSAVSRVVEVSSVSQLVSHCTSLLPALLYLPPTVAIVRHYQLPPRPHLTNPPPYPYPYPSLAPFPPPTLSHTAIIYLLPMCCSTNFPDSDLRRNPRRPQDLPRVRHPRRSHLHRARKAQDRHQLRCRLRAQATGPYPLWVRWLNAFVHYWVSESELGVRIPRDEGQGVAYYIMAMDD